jgi:2-oxoglutarate ferredoxin oxidoreductase subunit gamma
MKQINIRFCGFGGQGIVLSAVVLGTAAVTKAGLHAVQTQSYGSEARGGQCQAELIIWDRPINSPDVAMKDVLVAMSQSALDRYLPSLKEDGVLIIDPGLVTNTHGTKARVLEVPATETAQRLGNRICANMVILGFVQAATNMISKEDLVEVVKDSVPARFLDLNLRAVDAGIELAKGISLEVLGS